MEKITTGITPGCVLTAPPGGPADIPSLGCLSQVVVNVIQALFMFAGAASLIFLLYASIRFVVSRGDPKGVQAAQKTFTFAIIGTVLIFLSYLAINTVTQLLGLPSILDNFNIYQGT